MGTPASMAGFVGTRNRGAECTTYEPPQFEIPTDVRKLTEKSLEQVRTAIDGYLQFFQRDPIRAQHQCTMVCASRGCQNGPRKTAKPLRGMSRVEACNEHGETVLAFRGGIDRTR